MRVFLAVTGAALFVSGPALAQAQSPKVTQNDDGDKVICKSERIIGSHLSDRVCRTKSDWDAARFNDKHTLDRRNGELRAPKLKNSGG